MHWHVQEEFLSCMKMRMANILKDASAAKDLLAVQHGLRRQPGLALSNGLLVLNSTGLPTIIQ